MKKDFESLKRISKGLRRQILKMHACSGSSHIGSSLSVLDILVVLYFKILKITPKKCSDQNRDILILSKGHASSALYATLAARKFFPANVLATYCRDGGRLPGHVTKGCVPAIEASTGSLGHGLSIGVGMALAAKQDKRSSKVFVVLSDGECNEGSVWEAAMFAGHHKLDNLIAIVDYNKLQAFGKVRDVLDLEPFALKWQAFGWSCKEVGGHNFRELIDVLEKVPDARNKPTVIIAHTIKGKSVSFMENQLAWHYKSPKPDELKAALEELDLS